MHINRVFAFSSVAKSIVWRYITNTKSCPCAYISAKLR
jgi:hypothetical protein